MLALTVALGLAQAQQHGEEVDPATLVRVDVPDHPDALATSARGSVLRAPPTDGTPWRVEPTPDLHLGTGEYTADDAGDAIGAQAWHDAGWTGEGVRLAVFDVQWFNAELREEELGEFQTHDCWAHPGCTPSMDTLRPRFAYEEGGHGLACAELVRDLAPGVELHLVRTNGLTTFENAGAWAAREGIDLATLSMSFLNDSFYDGSGAVSQVVADMAEGGALLVTSAGNYADGHWMERYQDADLDGAHDFDFGGVLPVYLPAGRRGLTVQWDNYTRCGDVDLDAILYNADGEVVYRAQARQVAGEDDCTPVERLSPVLDEDQWTYLELVRVSGDADVRFRVLTTSGDVWQSMAAGSVTDPGVHPLALTVGAVRANGYAYNGPEEFSSHGPTASAYPKPELAAPDGVTTSVYGPSNFYGTSASSPVAAAAVALVMSRFPEMDAFEATRWLLANGTQPDPGSAWAAPDQGLGAGRLRLPPPQSSRSCGDAWRGASIVLPLMLLRRRRSRPPGS